MSSSAAADAGNGWAALADPEFEPLPDWLDTLIAGQGCTDWVVKNWAKAASVPGAWFDNAKADAVVALWPRVFRLTTLRFAGVPFRLSWWEEVIVRLLVGWKYPIEVMDPASGAMTTVQVRVFRELRLWIPRKNGKSEFLAGLALLFWALDGMTGAEGYVFARNEEQAGLAFAKIKEMVRQLPKADASRFQINTGSIWCPSLAAGFVLLTGSESGKHGKAPYVRLGDEMHEWKSRKVEDDLRQGSGVHLQPIGLLASTAGIKTSLTGMELWDETKAILDGTIHEPATLAVIFAAEPDDDWEDEAVWGRVNPNLHLSITLDYLRGEARKAKLNKRAEAHFRCYHLNQWVDDVVQWLDVRAWDQCTEDASAWTQRREAMAGRRCVGAFDLSAVRDITALEWLFEPTADSPRWQTFGRYWIPEEALKAKDKDLRDRLQRFVDIGALTVTPGEIVDQDYVMEAILQGLAEFDVEQLAFDKYYATKLITDLQKRNVDPDLLVEVRMGIQSLALPSQEFERLVYSGLLDHGGDPVLRWMARNCAIRFDENLNFMPAKRKSAQKIDGIMACVMALAAHMAEKEEKPVPGILVLD